jgi:hypothetical protein
LPISTTSTPSSVSQFARRGDDAPHDVHAVRAAGERHLRFVPVLGRAGAASIACVHVRRVADDHVVAPLGERRVEIAFEQRDAIVELRSRAHCAPRLRGPARQIDRVDIRVRKRVRGEDREATGTGAQFEHGANLFGIVHVRLQSVLQQFADERTRHDHAFVHVESESRASTLPA